MLYHIDYRTVPAARARFLHDVDHGGGLSPYENAAFSAALSWLFAALHSVILDRNG
jgi:hypothetical protein